MRKCHKGAQGMIAEFEVAEGWIWPLLSQHRSSMGRMAKRVLACVVQGPRGNV
jgi:hypothetical protein